MGFGVEEFDPDDVTWARGVDYVVGWREATDAAADLTAALTAAGVPLDGARATARSAADGSGVVRLMWSVQTVQAVVDLVRGDGPEPLAA
ncbi:hypothetical protein IPZ58_29070 [Streptomyces roseoverticillatus]|uniref:hypothetical protein n=1 Tax=Streptomyces roseoverticillatus TaxID=66429 RepID=UPI001F2EE342|nr:hypothetical protein [Streptomyces roseoverticillatus]MCF3105615.1 hypothetical protein [Streptomyces roseoverticillatus]